MLNQNKKPKFKHLTNPKVSQGHFGNIKGDLTYQSKFSRANARQASKKPTRKARKPFARVPANLPAKAARKATRKLTHTKHGCGDKNDGKSQRKFFAQI